MPYSVTAHAFDIFKEPQALPRKLAGASFVTSGCDYNVRHLREQVLNGPPGRGAQGDHGGGRGAVPEASPCPRDGTVLAVGRLVEKKGFQDLIRAAADPALRGLGSGS